MPVQNDTPMKTVKTMTEYHQRYSRGRLIHLGWEVYCKDCGRSLKLPSNVMTLQEARQRLLNIEWLPEEVEGYQFKWWLCPSCSSPFKETTDASTGH